MPPAPTIMRDVDIWLYDFFQNRSVQIQQAGEYKIERFLQGSEQLSFRLPLNDPKLRFLHEDQLVEAEGDFWIVDHVEESHPGYKTIVCNARWVELSWRIRYGPFSVLAKTPEQGLTQIMAGSGWTIDVAPVSVKLYTMEEMDGTTLSLLRRWAVVTGYELQFDNVNKTVSMVDAVGTTRQPGFRWGYDILEINRKFYPPPATRLYPVGANNLTISDANPDGLPYIENYDFYTDQGLSLVQARALYRKDIAWVDQRYLLSVNLYDAAVVRLAKLSQPRVFYSGKVIDVRRLMGGPTYAFLPGDTTTVDDEVLGVLENVRITRTVQYPNDPKRDEVELGFMTNGLLDVSDGGNRDINYNDVFMIIDVNSTELIIGNTSTNYGEIALTSAGAATVLSGSTFVGNASGTGTVEFKMVVDGVTQGQAYTATFTDGQLVEFSWPSLASDIPEGAHEIHWRAQVISGSGTITLPADAGRSWVLSRGAVGVGVNTSPNAFVSESFETYVDILTDSFTVEFVQTVPVVVEESDSIDVHVLDIEDRIIIPWQLEDPNFGQLDSIYGLAGPSDPSELGFGPYHPPAGGSSGGSWNYGPGPIGDGTPSAIADAGPEVWLRGTLGRGVTGSLLNVWEDQSGNNWDATALTGREPVHDSHTINGLAAVYFATGDAMEFPVGLLTALDTAGEGELFAVIEADSDTAAQGAFFQGFQGAPEYHHMMYSDGKWYAAFGRSTRVDTGNPSEDISSPALINMRSDSTEWSLHINEVQHYTTATNTVDFTGGPSSFGGSALPLLGGDPNANSGAGVWWAGVIAEFVIFPRKLGTTERADVIAELNTRYAL